MGEMIALTELGGLGVGLAGEVVVLELLPVRRRATLITDTIEGP